MEKITAYIGLLTAGGKEPDEKSGYCRVCIGEMELREMSSALENRQIVFQDVQEPGYGIVEAAALYNMEKGGVPMAHWNFQMPLDVHAGVVPVIQNGRLWRGMDVTAKLCIEPGAACNAGGW